MSPISLNRLLLKKVVSINSLFFVCIRVVSGGHFPKSKPSCDLENGVKVTKI